MIQSEYLTISDFLFLFVSDLNVVVYENEINEDYERIVFFEGRVNALRNCNDLQNREIFQIQYTNNCLFIFLM